MRNRLRRESVTFKEAKEQGLLGYAERGWQDAAKGLPFPRDYDTWHDVDQTNYELSRQAYVEAHADRSGRPLAMRTVITRCGTYAPTTLAFRNTF
jgi:hypothetical protein